MTKLNRIALFGAALALSTGVSAASFDFTGGSTSGATSSDGVITVSFSTPSGSVTATGGGVGVKDGWVNAGALQNNETLRLDFSATTNIGSLFLTGWEGPDRLTLTYDGGVVDINDDNNGWGSNETYAINLTGVTFITLKGNSWGTATRLSGLGNVSATPSEVPVPAAAWLFGTALVGLAGIARKRG